MLMSMVSCALGDHLQCSVCEAGSFCFADASTLCVEHSESPVGSRNASDCVCYPGYHEENRVCKRCPAGSYCPGNDAHVACPVNSFSPEFSSGIVDCECVAGFTGVAEVGCVECAMGSFKTERGSAACTQ